MVTHAKGYVVDAAEVWRNICIHAGNQEYVDLTVLQPAHVMWNDDALRRRLYSVGDC